MREKSSGLTPGMTTLGFWNVTKTHSQTPSAKSCQGQSQGWGRYFWNVSKIQIHERLYLLNLTDTQIQITLTKVGWKCILDTDKMHEWAVSSVSFDTVSKILPNPGQSMDLQRTGTSQSVLWRIRSRTRARACARGTRSRPPRRSWRRYWSVSAEGKGGDAEWVALRSPNLSPPSPGCNGLNMLENC